MSIDSNKEDFSNSLNMSFKLDCSKREANVAFNHMVIPDNVTTQEQDIHNFLDSLNVNQVNIKETH
jgi:hypothetical protein